MKGRSKYETNKKASTTNTTCVSYINYCSYYNLKYKINKCYR